MNYNFGENTWLSGGDTPVREWSEPEIYEPLNRADKLKLEHLKMFGRTGVAAQVIRRLEPTANDMFEIEYPSLKQAAQDRERYVTNVMREGDDFGRWVYFEYDNVLAQYPERDLHYEIRTNRHADLFTHEEQQTLGKATLYFAGLSVGSLAAISAAHLGMGRRFILDDPDTITPTNLNRLPWASMRDDVGLLKVDALAMHLSKLDPYLELELRPDGVTEKNAEVIEVFNPDIIYEHTDNLTVKLLLRNVAEHIGKPLIMATDVDDVSLIDVERHDRDHDIAFLNMLTSKDRQAIIQQTLTPDDYQQLVKKLVGEENISPRMEKSMRQIGRTVVGFPQKGTTAMVGGALATAAGSEILLGDGPATGRSVLSVKALLGY